MKASELLRELDGARNGDWFRDGQLQPNGHLAWRAVHLLPLIADVVEAAESVYADNEDGEIGIALWPVLTALTAALQPPTEGSPPPPEGATAPWTERVISRGNAHVQGPDAALEGDTPR